MRASWATTVCDHCSSWAGIWSWTRLNSKGWRRSEHECDAHDRSSRARATRARATRRRARRRAGSHDPCIGRVLYTIVQRMLVWLGGWTAARGDQNVLVAIGTSLLVSVNAGIHTIAF